MQSVLSSVDHEEQNEKKQLNYQNQEGLLGHQNCLKQILYICRTCQLKCQKEEVYNLPLKCYSI